MSDTWSVVAQRRLARIAELEQQVADLQRQLEAARISVKNADAAYMDWAQLAAERGLEVARLKLQLKRPQGPHFVRARRPA